MLRFLWAVLEAVGLNRQAFQYEGQDLMKVQPFRTSTKLRLSVLHPSLPPLIAIVEDKGDLFTF